MRKKWIRRVVIAVAGLFVAWAGVGLVLTLLPEPAFEGAPADLGGEVEWPAAANPTVAFATPAGDSVRAKLYAGDGRVVVVLLHGVLTDARLYGTLASMMRDAAGADILALDLRGHGLSDGTPGDVAYIDQYGEDVAAVIRHLRQQRGGARIVLAGHSMGGGIALRYAEQRRRPAPDGYLLFAPLMGPDSPTFMDRSDDVDGAASFMKVHVPRLIGLLMLNAIGAPWLNGKRTLLFNLPAGVPIRTYSFRAMVSMTPRNHLAALQADSLPMLAIVGRADGTFHVDRFPAVIAHHHNGAAEIIDGADHTGVLFSPPAASAAARWLEALGH